MSLTNVESHLDILSLPKGGARQYLDAEIAGEGQKVNEGGELLIQSDGTTVNWTPPPAALVIPDMSQIKSIRRYFGRSNHPTYPAWLYHEDGRSILVKTAQEAAQLGVVYRSATIDEKGRYGVEKVWDYEDGCKWRARPWTTAKFNPSSPGTGKNYVPAPPNPMAERHELAAALVPLVAGAVAQALKGADGPKAPANIDAAQWDEFLAFQAWKKTQEVVNQAAEASEIASDEPEDEFENALTPEQDRVLWEAEAERRGVKIDKRWGLQRLKEEVEKAA